MGTEPQSRSLPHQLGPVLVKDQARNVRGTEHGEGLAECLAPLSIESGVGVGELAGHADLNRRDPRRLHAITPSGSSPGGHPRIRAANARSVPSYDPENQVTTPDLLPSAVTPLASQAAVARALGLSRKTVTVWKRRGNLIMAGDQVDLNATAAQLLRTHADGPMLVTRLADLSAETVTPPAKGNTNSVTTPVTPPRTVTPRQSLAPVAEAVVAFAERIAIEGGHCAWEAGITREQAAVADRLFRDGLITDAAEFLDGHIAAPSGGDWLSEPVWQGIRDTSPDWSRLEQQRVWEVAEGFTPGRHAEAIHAES